MSLENKSILKSWTVLSIVLELAYLLELLKGARSIGYLSIFSLLNIVPLVASYVFARNKKNTARVKYVASMGYIVFYAFCLFTANSVITCTYSLPMLFALVVFMHVRLTVFFGTVNTILNLAYVGCNIFLYDPLWKENLASYEIQVALAIICCIFAISSVKAVRKENENKLDSINQTNCALNSAMDTIKSVAVQVNVDAEELEKTLETVSTGASSVQQALSEIADGTQQVAEAIETQMYRTNEIQDIISKTTEAGNDTKEKIDLMHQNVSSGIQDMQLLAESATSIMQSGTTVNENMVLLKNTVGEMTDVIDIISGIAGQTNLLALNAAIEAARVGEAGRGFAVVASNINTLATQSKEAIESISDMVNRLVESSDEVQTSVENVVTLNKKQNTLIDNVNSIFATIAEQTNACKENTEKSQRQMENLLTANAEIVNSIAGISAVSEEVTANATSAETSAEDGKDRAQEAFGVVKDLRDSVASLQKTLTQEA